MRKYKSDKTAFANGLFSNQLDRYYIPEFVTVLGLRNTEYDIFRMIYFYTDQNINGGYMTYQRRVIAKEFDLTIGTVDKAFARLLKRGLIIREPVQRDGRIVPGYRVDKAEIKRMIEETKMATKSEPNPLTCSAGAVSQQLGHLTALEHSVPFTPARPLRYPKGEPMEQASHFGRGGTEGDGEGNFTTARSQGCTEGEPNPLTCSEVALPKGEPWEV